MSMIRASKLRAFAQLLCIFLFVSPFEFMSAHAEPKPSTETKSPPSASSKKMPTTSAECDNIPDGEKNDSIRRRCSELSGGVSTSTDQCVAARVSVKAANMEMNRLCGEAGLGSSCMATLKKCDKVASDTESLSDDDFFKALGVQVGVNTSKGSSKCPKYSGQGFFERKDKYERSLDDVNDKLGDIEEKIADLNKDFTKDMQEVQEDLQKAQDEVKQKDLDISKAQRERATETLKTTSEVASLIRKKQSEILALRTQIAETYRSKNSNLIAMTENAAKRACMKKVNELKKEYAAISAGSLRSGFAAASKKKKELNDTFNECISQFDVQRGALVTQTDEKIDAIQNQINNNQSDIDNATQQLASMTEQETKAKADEGTEKQNAANSVQEKITRGQAKLKSLAETTQKKAAALEKKQAYFKDKGAQVSRSLASLGAIPEDETSTTKLSQVQGAYESVKDAVMAMYDTKDLNDEQCQFNYEQYLGSDFVSGSNKKEKPKSNEATKKPKTAT